MPALFTVLHYLLRKMESSVDCKNKLVMLLEENPFIDSKAMGFPDNWQEHNIWK